MEESEREREEGRVREREREEGRVDKDAERTDESNVRYYFYSLDARARVF